MGKNSVISGLKYEKKIHSILSNTTIDNVLFNTQDINELAGCTNKPDIICNYNNIEIAIEIKKSKSPECMQCKLNYIDNKWIPSDKANIHFNDLLKNIKLFNGKIPPFLEKKLTIYEWNNIKNSCNDFKDIYINIPNDTVKKLYSSKGCYYIQIYTKGLYHLGNDICNFNVPELVADQKIRIRIKNHGSKNGYCNLSVTAGCYFVDIKQLPNSKYSLDNINKLPPKLYYNN
jgi:hypothetical protein